VEIPRTIGKYEVLERIGKGGFGVVYKGRDPFIKRLVAVKVCTSSDETLKRRFLREAEIAGNLHHRNIVTVFEFGYDDHAGPFLAQEYLSGEDLEAKIRRAAPILQDVRLGYLLQIARALEYAHKKGILHRDVKPGNVRVLEDDRVKILDFGIAKLSGAETQLTRSGRVMGTAGYLSPEQIKGEPVDARSDVFSFGVLAYELLTYVHPFPGTTISELLHQVVRSEPRPIAAVWPECPPEIAAAVTRCLEKDPERRWASFSEVAETLASVLAGLREGGADSEVLSPLPPEALSGQAHPPEPPTVQMPRLSSSAPPLPPAPPPAEPGDLEATQAVLPLAGPRPAPGGPASARNRRLALAAAVLLAVFALAVAIAWIGWRRWISAPAAGSGAPEAAASGPAAGPAEGLLVVDAVPWGEVLRVTDGEGTAVSLPEDAFTPLVLTVEPGSYTARISNPESIETLTCQAEVGAGDTARCSTEFYRLEAVEYFQEAGWWR
jgi:serine/threonine protein kinase